MLASQGWLCYDCSNRSYDQVRYDLRIDYRAEPDPPLAPGNAEWADRLLAIAGLRE